MPASQVLRFTDPDEYAAHVRATRMEIAVTEHGHFSAELIRIDLHRSAIPKAFRESHTSTTGPAVPQFHSQR